MKVPKGPSPKLYPKWNGPFYVINVRQNNTCKVRRCSDHKLIKSRIHTNRLKMYNDPRDFRVPQEILGDDVDDVKQNTRMNQNEHENERNHVPNDNVENKNENESQGNENNEK